MPCGCQRYTGFSKFESFENRKYHVQRHAGRWAVCAVRSQNGVRERFWDDSNPVIDAVNEVKICHNGQSGGGFWINEFGHVVVTTESLIRYSAGRLTRPLELRGDCGIITAEAAPGLAGGAEWPGPQQGACYKITASGTDIATDANFQNDGYAVRETLRLSEFVGSDRAERLARRFSRFKASGRIYVNEARLVFGPVQKGGGWVDIYLGSIEANDPWFPEPGV